MTWASHRISPSLFPSPRNGTVTAPTRAGCGEDHHAWKLLGAWVNAQRMPADPFGLTPLGHAAPVLGGIYPLNEF